VPIDPISVRRHTAPYNADYTYSTHGITMRIILHAIRRVYIPLYTPSSISNPDTTLMRETLCVLRHAFCALFTPLSLLVQRPDEDSSRVRDLAGGIFDDFQTRDNHSPSPSTAFAGMKNVRTPPPSVISPVHQLMS